MNTPSHRTERILQKEKKIQDSFLPNGALANLISISIKKKCCKRPASIAFTYVSYLVCDICSTAEVLRGRVIGKCLFGYRRLHVHVPVPSVQSSICPPFAIPLLVIPKKMIDHIGKC